MIEDTSKTVIIRASKDPEINIMGDTCLYKVFVGNETVGFSSFRHCESEQDAKLLLNITNAVVYNMEVDVLYSEEVEYIKSTIQQSMKKNE